MEIGESFNLKGKTALVTGAAQGLGREIGSEWCFSGFGGYPVSG
jgi:NAD(P)-dependent dehydrogenase (short-subunit alcohol dehydrogenase family)